MDPSPRPSMAFELRKHEQTASSPQPSPPLGEERERTNQERFA
ncbi:MAG: hypothetical protein QOJ40_3030 [Verrucomicrobiota bacterium]